MWFLWPRIVKVCQRYRFTFATTDVPKTPSCYSSWNQKVARQTVQVPMLSYFSYYLGSPGSFKPLFWCPSYVANVCKCQWSRLGLSENFHRVVSLECAGEFQLQASELFQKYAKLSKKLGPQEPEKKTPKSTWNFTSRRFFVGSCWTTHQHPFHRWMLKRKWFSIQFLKLFAVVYFYVYDSACIYDLSWFSLLNVVT